MERRLRLRQRIEFRRLREEGRVLRHPYLTLSYAKNQLSVNRYGFITPKHLGKAVERNRIRRQMREAVRLLHSRFRQGYDVVIIARPAILSQRFQQIERTLYEMFDRAGLVLKDNL